jgi:hypothetical protein
LALPINRALRSPGYTGFPVARAAETCFARQIQKLMFDLYEEHLQSALSQVVLEEVCDLFHSIP